MMFGAKKRVSDAHADPSALDALLEAEQAIAADLQRSEREAERVVSEARAAAAAADEIAARDLEQALRLLAERAASQREADARAIRDDAARHTRLFAEASDATIASIATHLVSIVAPAAPAS